MWGFSWLEVGRQDLEQEEKPVKLKYMYTYPSDIMGGRENGRNRLKSHVPRGSGPDLHTEPHLKFLGRYPDDPSAASKTLILDETCNVAQVIVRATSIFRKPVHPDPTDGF